VVERAVYQAQGGRIADIRFDPFDVSPTPALRNREPGTVSAPDPPPAALIDPLSSLPLKEAVAQLQLNRLQEALQHTRYNQRKAAIYLGLTYDQFRGLRRKFKDRLKI
jgi:psp operon transcriptional activator